MAVRRRPTTGPELVKPPGWQWHPMHSDVTCVEELRRDFTERVPQFLPQAADRESDLPFPPALVRGITDADVDFIGKSLRIDAGAKYKYLVQLYYHVNYDFLELDRRQEAATMLARLEKIVPTEVPRPPLILMIGRAYLSARDRKEYLRRSKDTKPKIEWLREKLTAPTKRLIGLIEKGRARFPYQCYEDQVRGAFEETIDRIEDAIRCLEMRESLDASVFHQDVPRTRNADERGDAFYWSFEGVRELIRTRWRKHGHLQMTKQVFSSFGMDVTQSSLESFRYRQARD